MAIGDAEHAREEAEQAAIAEEVAAAEDQAAKDAEEAPVEDAPVDPAPPVEEEVTVTVKATNPDLSSACVAGYPFDFTESDTVEEVPAEIAALFEDSPNVEIVEEAA